MRTELERCPVRILNIGGFANPDVLLVENAHGEPLVVKDYARRGAWVRRAVAPFLVRHEIAMLRRLERVRGIPRFRGRIDRLAFAMEYLEGHPLEAKRFRQALPPLFFEELEATLDAFAQAGVFYTDLRSPTNVLVTADGHPGVVDLASAWRLPLPRPAIRAIERSALRKLRRRFEGDCEIGGIGEAEYRDLHSGRARIRTTEAGPLSDPVPAVLIPDPGWPAEIFSREARALAKRGRRAVGLELAGFGGSRFPGSPDGMRGPEPGRSMGPLASEERGDSSAGVHDPAGAATALAFMLDVLRLRRVDVVARGFAGLVVRELAHRQPERIRALVCVGAPGSGPPDESLAELFDAAEREGASIADAVLRSARAELPRELWPAVARALGVTPKEALLAAYRGLRATLAVAQRRDDQVPRWLSPAPGPRSSELSRELARDPEVTVQTLLALADGSH